MRACSLSLSLAALATLSACPGTLPSDGEGPLDEEAAAPEDTGYPAPTCGRLEIEERYAELYPHDTYCLALGVEGEDPGLLRVAARVAGAGSNAPVDSPLASGGDMGGDGVPDVVVVRQTEGRVYVLDGPVRGDTSLSSADATVTASISAGDNWRDDSAHILPDMDGDGLDELVTGFPYAADRLGAVYLFQGPARGDLEEEDADARLLGDEEASLGYGLASGDLSGDGAVDLLVRHESADGAVGPLVFTGPLAGSLDPDDPDGWFSSESYLWLGPVASGGDLDGDGIDEVAMFGTDLYGSTRMNVYRGPFLGERDLDDVDWVSYYSSAGYPVDLAFPGDVDGDGLADLALTWNYWYQCHSKFGLALYVGDTSALLEDAASVGYYACESSPHDLSLAGPGDVNADGYADLLAGWGEAHGIDGGTGAAYVFYGPLTGSHVLGDADLALAGYSGLDNAGTGVAAAGDQNGDGYRDLLIGAPLDDYDDPDGDDGVLWVVLMGGW